MASWYNYKLVKWQVDKMPVSKIKNCQRDNLMKWQVDQMESCQSDTLIKRKMAKLQIDN